MKWPDRLRLINRKDKTEPFAEWVIVHPGRWGVASGLGVLALTAATFGRLLLAVVVGAAAGLLNFAIWRHGGPARRWHERKAGRPARNG